MLEALEFMAEKNVGAVVVLEKGEMVGIISERDFARAIARLDKRNSNFAFMRTSKVNKRSTAVSRSKPPG